MARTGVFKSWVHFLVKREKLYESLEEENLIPSFEECKSSFLDELITMQSDLDAACGDSDLFKQQFEQVSASSLAAFVRKMRLDHWEGNTVCHDSTLIWIVKNVDIFTNKELFHVFLKHEKCNWMHENDNGESPFQMVMNEVGKIVFDC